MSIVYADGPVFITEIQMGGESKLADEDGEYPDWMEIYNPGNTDVSLQGWYLTDDPQNLKKWAFPEIQLSAGGYRVIFASGKDRKNPKFPLHTNFKLNSEGEYLALVEPDGRTIAFQYAPTYPNQKVPKSGYSYGTAMAAVPYVSLNSSLRYQIPKDAALGETWKTLNFDDSQWSEGKNGVGFASANSAFTVTTFQALDLIDSLFTAVSIAKDSSLRKSEFTESVGVINFMDNGDDGNYSNDQPFPGHSAGEDLDNFVVQVAGTIVIPSDGFWTFGVNSDEGSQLQIDGVDVIVDDDSHNAMDNFGAVELKAGFHTLQIIYFEQTGGAELELFAASGQYNDFDSRAFRLVGDTANGGLEVGGFNSLIQTNLESGMKNINSTVYLRIPFSLADFPTQAALNLRMKYNDGFVAYINGYEIARRNAANLPVWNSTAVQKRSLEETLTTETIPVTIPAGILQSGNNLLAIQGFNVRAGDGDFLLVPELESIKVDEKDRRFFKNPTPGSLNGAGVLGFIAEVGFSREHGFCFEPFPLILNTVTADAVIRYTTDGTLPTETHGVLYTDPISIQTTAIIRAGAFKAGFESPGVKTQTYIYPADVVKQKNPPGYPTRWAGTPADYAMDSRVVNNSLYKNTIQNDLQSLPVFSIVMDPDDLFGSARGIYAWPDNKGEIWERPASTELIYADNRKGFQVNHGIRIQGGYGRSPSVKKHSFRLLFRSSYGPAKLQYPLFPDSRVDQFNQLVLRSNYNYTWHAGESGFGSNVGKADYLRDEFSRKTQLATGQVCGHGDFVHLYLNGLYWGLYNLTERPDDGFSASYLGGNKEEYDVITSGTRGINTVQVKAGNKETWSRMMSLVEKGGFQNADRYTAIQEYVDIDALIDYMLVIYYTGNRDAPTVIGGGGTPWNFYSSHRRIAGGLFRFFAWDSEWTLEEPTVNAIRLHNGRDNPARIFQQLRTNPEFLLRVADHIQKHFFNGGAMTPEVAVARYAALAQRIDRAIVCESARWGDVQYPNSPRTRDANWVPERDRILKTYLPVRTKNVLQQFKTEKLFPSLDAPVFNKTGGVVDAGFELTMSSLPTSEPKPIPITLIDMEEEWKYEQSGKDLGTTWREMNFNDTPWLSGKALFYVESADLPAAKNTALTLGKSTYYFRKHFHVDPNINLKDMTLELSLIVDDGAVIYLNGTEVYRIGIPAGEILSASFSDRTVSDAALEGPVLISHDKIVTGENVLAVEVHQCNASSSDVVFGLTLNATATITGGVLGSVPIYFTLDGSDPRLPGGQINSEKALQYLKPIPLRNNVLVKARAFNGQIWSALNEALFFIQTPSSETATLKNNLRITELMYDPPDGSDFEYIELQNTHPVQPLSLTGVALMEGIEFAFPSGIQISPQGYLLVTKAQTDAEKQKFRNHYGLDTQVSLSGPYAGKLANEGETVSVKIASEGMSIVSFRYSPDRGWPLPASGAGHALVPWETMIPGEDQGVLNYGGNWRSSFIINGSPGKADPIPNSTVVLNEISANAENGNDWIELYNPTNSAIRLQDYYLSDDAANLRQWRIPTVDIRPGEWISFDEETGFNPPVGSGFALGQNGEQLFLSYLPGVAGTDRVVDWVRYKAQERGISLGRYPDGAPFWYAMPPSRNSNNRFRTEHVVLDEIQYHPLSTAESPEDDTGDEYIELYNPTDQTVNFWNENGVWRLDGGVKYQFAPNIALPSKGRILLVGFNPKETAALAEFKKTYNEIPIDVPIYGPFIGNLSNSGGNLTLEKPLSLDPLEGTPAYAIVDEVIYFHQTPWTPLPDGSGFSLQRLEALQSGNDPNNWVGKSPTPGIGYKPDTKVKAWMVY